MKIQVLLLTSFLFIYLFYKKEKCIIYFFDPFLHYYLSIIIIYHMLLDYVNLNFIYLFIYFYKSVYLC